MKIVQMKIESKYFDDDGHLNTEGRAVYVNAVENDNIASVPELRKHVKECIKCTTEIEELLKLSETMSYTTQQPHTTPENAKPNNFSIYKVAAAVTIPVILGLSIWLFVNKYSDQSLFNSYFETYEASELRGTNDTPSSNVAFDHGMISYSDGNFEAAINSFEKADLNNMYTRFYLGICYLKIDNPNESIGHLEYVSKKFDHFKDASTWYLALASLKRGDITSTKSLLKKLTSDPYTDSFYKSKAKDLLSDLDSVWR